MYWTIDDLSTTSGIGGLMTLFGLLIAVTILFPHNLTKGHVNRSSDSLDQDYRIWRRIRVAVVTFGVCLAVAGTLMQVYWT